MNSLLLATTIAVVLSNPFDVVATKVIKTYFLNKLNIMNLFLINLIFKLNLLI